MINKLKFFIVKLLAKMLGFSISITKDTITFYVKSERGIKNLKKILLNVVSRLEKDKLNK